jgi:hypothetical protein
MVLTLRRCLVQSSSVTGERQIIPMSSRRFVLAAAAGIIGSNPGPVTSRPLPGLLAPGPASAYRAQLADFGRLIGHWKMSIETYRPDGSVLQRIKGTWDFGWILEGRAVQDVFVTFPTHPDPSSHLSPSIGEHGTTVRMYDPALDAWQVTYFGPRHDLIAAFVARRQGADMVLERKEPNGDLTHWVFDRIESGSFRWRALTSSDGGATWKLDQTMIGTRG